MNMITMFYAYYNHLTNEQMWIKQLVCVQHCARYRINFEII